MDNQTLGYQPCGHLHTPQHALPVQNKIKKEQSYQSLLIFNMQPVKGKIFFSS